MRWLTIVMVAGLGSVAHAGVDVDDCGVGEAPAANSCTVGLQQVCQFVGGSKVTCYGGSVPNVRYAVANYGSSPDDIAVWGTHNGSPFCCSIHADTSAELSVLEIWGSPSSDVIDLSYGADELTAPTRWVADGNTLRAVVYAGNGSNTVHGSDSDDSLYQEGLYGGSGVDTINGNGGDDHICGLGAGDDLDGGAGNDVIEGGEGDDDIFGREGNDEIWGCLDTSEASVCGDSDDCAEYALDDDYIDGGDNRDELYGQWGVDEIHGGDQVDYIEGGPDGDFLYGDEWADEIHGGDGGDTIEGGSGDDLIRGEGGWDTIYGDDATDLTVTGDDQLDGGAGNDELHGGPGDDDLQGGSGGDTLYGGTGSDVLCSGLNKFASDFLEGGSGIDRMWVSPASGTPTGGFQDDPNDMCQASPVWWTGTCAQFWWTTLSSRPSECTF